MIFGTKQLAPAAVSGRFGSVDGSHAGSVPSIWYGSSGGGSLTVSLPC